MAPFSLPYELTSTSYICSNLDRLVDRISSRQEWRWGITLSEYSSFTAGCNSRTKFFLLTKMCFPQIWSIASSTHRYESRNACAIYWKKSSSCIWLPTGCKVNSLFNKSYLNTFPLCEKNMRRSCIVFKSSSWLNGKSIKCSLLKIPANFVPSWSSSLSIKGSLDFLTLKWWFMMWENEYSSTKMLDKLIL